ncbi:MAG: FtsX-like permease family protein [Clostridiales bacterium]|nr:FtsX-like permease family protein [Clostridiales bacterium]
MKSARRKNILRGIRQSLNRFISILFIVALGAGFLAGLSATSPDMFENADKYMDEYRMYDIDVKATLGLTDSDVDAIAQVDGVALVQPARVLDMVLVDEHDNELTTRVFALLDNDGATDLNQFELKEGRLPKAIDECVIQSSAGRYTLNAPQIGDTLTLAESSNDSASEYASSNTLRVVGIVESPMCISVEREPSTAGTGSVALQAFVRNEFLTMDFYTDCYLLVQDAAQLDTCSNEYTTLIDDMTAKLETLGDKHASLRADELREQGKQKIDSAQAFMNSFESVIGTRTELAEDAAMRAKQTAAAAALINSNPELAQKLVATAKAVGDALSSASDDKENAQARIERLNADIADAQNALDEIGDGTWLVRTRADSVGYANYKDNVEKVSALCKVFPMFFFLVALLVALTTMTRLIEERRTQIGTLKALGYTDWQIFGEYILYSLSAAVLGCAIGFLGGFKLFPTVINSAYGMMYTLPPMDAPFRLDIALLVAPVTIGGILLATVWVCYSVCRSRPAPLMQPKAPAPGKRIFLEHIPALWKRMSFTQKVTCRNLFRYKKRLFMTIIGMAGCSALMLTGFGLRDSIDDIVYKQFGEIDLYQMSIVLNDANAIDNDAELKALLTSDSRVSAYMPYHSETGRIQSASGSESISLAVPENSDMLDEYIVLRERKSARPLALTDDGIILTEKLCEKLGISVGDAVTLENADGKRAQLCVDGISENYIASYAFLTANCYRDAYNSDVGYTTLLCLTDSNAGMDVLLADAIHCESVLYASASSTLMNTFNDSVKSIDAIVWVLILAAGMLSMVVNYNLTNVNICERKKEIATIRVLGFHEREVEKYIFRETNALSIMGSLIGLPVGIWLHSFVVRTVEVNSIMFGREIKPLSYAMAIAISLLFTFIINRIMSCSIRKVDMVESMKAND